MADNLGGVAAAATAAPASAPAAPSTGSPGTFGGQTGTPSQSPIQSATPSANQAPGAPKTYDVKVDGQVMKMTEAQLMEAASLGKAAFKRMEEATTVRRQAEAFIEKFRQDPMAALEDPALGLSEAQRRDAIEKYYQKKYIEQDKLSPEQKQLQEAQRELNKYKEKEQSDKKQLEAQQHEQLQAHWRGHYQQQIMTALDTAGLPKTPQTVGRMAFYMAQAAKNKVDAPMEMIVNQVRQDYQQAFQELTQNSPAEALVNFLGPDAAKKIQRYALDQHKKRLAEGQAPVVQETRPRERKTQESDSEGWKKVSQYWTRHSK